MAFPRVRRRVVDRGCGSRHRSERDECPSQVEDAHDELESPPGRTDQVVGRHLHVGEPERASREAPAAEVVEEHRVQSRRRGRDVERRHAGVVEAGQHDHSVRGAEVADRGLVAGQHEAVFGAGGPAPDARSVRPGLGLGQRERDQAAPGQQRRQYGIADYRRRLPDRRGRERTHDRQLRHGEVGPSEFLDHDAEVDRRCGDAAEFGR
jgi:hypothetical protein